ncbi:hypothetical protein C0993_004498, partial [Termitomyces sp. T159_Od127]
MTIGQLLLLFLYGRSFFDVYTYCSKATKKSATPQKRLSKSTPSKALDLGDDASPAKKSTPAKRKKTVDSDSEEDEDMEKAVISRPRKKMTVVNSSEDESTAKVVTNSTQAHKAKKKPRASTSQKTAKKDDEFI